MPDLRLLSLGAGVQSTTLALMAIEGRVDSLDGVIFGDTGWEPQAVYDHLDRLAVVLANAGIPLHQVSAGNLRADAINPARRYAGIPYHIRNPDGTDGMGRRQCTDVYKLSPINRKVRELLGAAAPDYKRVPRGVVAEQWIGFSSDEIGRVGGGRGVRYIRPRYPLIEMGMDRKACVRWLNSRGWTSVEKSACIGCPYHGNAQWRAMRDNRPDQWADAVEFDQQIRKGGARGLPLIGEAFLHRSRVPLASAPIDHVTRRERVEAATHQQLTIYDDLDESGDPDGCSPYGCRSGTPVAPDRPPDGDTTVHTGR